MTRLAEKFVDVLRGARGQENALTSLSLGRAAGMRGTEGAVTREVRRIIAEEYGEMQADLLPHVLLAAAPHGYWLASDGAELQRRNALLKDLKQRATEKLAEFQRVAGQAGFPKAFLDRRAA